MAEEKSLDIIREVINIGIGDAASALSELVKDRVIIRTPEVEIMNMADIPGYIRNEMSSLGVYISQDFGGMINGKTLLFYTKECSISLLNALYGEGMVISSLSSSGMATLQEIGNIIMVSCISTISNMMDTNLTFFIPQVTEEISDGYFQNLLKDMEEFDQAIIVKNEMAIKGKDIQGYLFVLLSFEGFQLVIEKLESS